MFKISALTPLVLVAALGLVSTESFATTFKYRFLNRGIRAPLSAVPSTGGTTESTAGGTSPPVGGGSTNGTTAPVTPSYATSGAQFIKGGQVVTDFVMAPNTEYTLVLKNSASTEMRGWLGSSNNGLATADMSRSTCGQNTGSGSPTVLAPGASCSFVLVAGAMSYSHPDDTFSFKSLSGTVIPSQLILRGLSNGPQPTPAPAF